MVGWHHRLNGCEFEQHLGDDEEQGSLVRCRLRGRTELDTTEVTQKKLEDSILKSRDITLSTKVHLVKAMVFPVVMYGCEELDYKES